MYKYIIYYEFCKGKRHEHQSTIQIKRHITPGETSCERVRQARATAKNAWPRCGGGAQTENPSPEHVRGLTRRPVCRNRRQVCPQCRSRNQKGESECIVRRETFHISRKLWSLCCRKRKRLCRHDQRRRLSIPLGCLNDLRKVASQGPLRGVLRQSRLGEIARWQACKERSGPPQSAECRASIDREKSSYAPRDGRGAQTSCGHDHCGTLRGLAGA